MKHVLSLLLLLFAFNASAIDIKPSLSGAWYNPDQNGHGLAVEVLEGNRTLIYWYVYHTDGMPMFLITVGENQGNRTTGDTYYQTGMKFGDFDPNDIQQTVWGTTTVTFNDCGSASLQYSANDPAYGSGTIQMQRLTSIAGNKCTNSPVTGNYHLTFGRGGNYAFGVANFFENGFFGFHANGPAGSVTGFGEYVMDGNNHFDMELTVFEAEGGWEKDTARALYQGGGFIIDLPDGANIVGTKVENFQRSLTSGMLTGTYDIAAASGIVGTFTINSDGTAIGNIFNGCDFNGLAYAPDEKFNQLVVDLSTSNCDWGTQVIGAGNIGGDDNLYLALTDGWLGLTWVLKK